MKQTITIACGPIAWGEQRKNARKPDHDWETCLLELVPLHLEGEDACQLDAFRTLVRRAIGEQRPVTLTLALDDDPQPYFVGLHPKTK